MYFLISLQLNIDDTKCLCPIFIFSLSVASFLFHRNSAWIVNCIATLILKSLTYRNDCVAVNFSEILRLKWYKQWKERLRESYTAIQLGTDAMQVYWRKKRKENIVCSISCFSASPLAHFYSEIQMNPHSWTSNILVLGILNWTVNRQNEQHTDCCHKIDHEKFDLLVSIRFHRMQFHLH